jgi:hypothetical protein
MPQDLKSDATYEEHEPRGSSRSNGGGSYEPTDDEKKAIKLVMSLYKQSSKNKRKYDKDWLKYYKMFRGKQWSQQRPAFRHSEVLNFIFSHIQSQGALMTDTRPTFQYTAEEPSDREFAEILSQVAEADWKKNNWMEDLTEAIFDGHFYGTGFTYVGYDPEKNRGRGSVCFESTDPFYIFPDPMARSFQKRCRYVILAEPTPTSEVKKKAPEDLRQFIKPDLSSFYGADKTKTTEETYHMPEDDMLATSDGDTGELKEESMSLLITLLIKDDEMIEEEIEDTDDEGNKLTDEAGNPKKAFVQRLKYPNGRKVVVCNKVLLADENFDFDDGEFPYQRYQNYVNPREFFGISEVEPLEGPQTTFNKLVSFAVDVLTLMGNPVWVVGVDSMVDEHSLQNRPGAVITKAPNTEVNRLEGTQLQPYVIQMIDRYKTWFDDVSGSQDVSRGASEGVSSARAIIALQEAAQTRIRGKTRSLDVMIRDIGRHYAARAMQFYTVPRVFRLTNRDGTEKYFKFHVEHVQQPDGTKSIVGKYRDIDVKQDTGERLEGQSREYILRGQLDVSVDSGTSLPMVKYERKQEALELYDRQIIDEEEVLRSIDYPNKEKVLERLKARKEAEAQAAAEAQAQKGAQ